MDLFGRTKKGQYYPKTSAVGSPLGAMGGRGDIGSRSNIIGIKHWKERVTRKAEQKKLAELQKSANIEKELLLQKEKQKAQNIEKIKQAYRQIANLNELQINDPTNAQKYLAQIDELHNDINKYSSVGLDKNKAWKNMAKLEKKALKRLAMSRQINLDELITDEEQRLLKEANQYRGVTEQKKQEDILGQINFKLGDWKNSYNVPDRLKNKEGELDEEKLRNLVKQTLKPEERDQYERAIYALGKETIRVTPEGTDLGAIGKKTKYNLDSMDQNDLLLYIQKLSPQEKKKVLEEQGMRINEKKKGILGRFRRDDDLFSKIDIAKTLKLNDKKVEQKIKKLQEQLNKSSKLYKMWNNKSQDYSLSEEERSNAEKQMARMRYYDQRTIAQIRENLPEGKEGDLERALVESLATWSDELGTVSLGMRENEAKKFRKKYKKDINRILQQSKILPTEEMREQFLKLKGAELLKQKKSKIGDIDPTEFLYGENF